MYRMGTTAGTRPETDGVTLTEAAQLLGISRDALKKRVQRGAIPAYKDESGGWRIVLPDGDGAGDIAGDLSRDMREGLSPGQVSPAVPGQLAAVMDQWLQPLVNQIATQAQEIGELTADLRNERERSQHLQREYDVAKKELAGLRMLARAGEQRRASAESQSTMPLPAIVADVPPSSERSGDDESRVPASNAAPEGAQRAERASWRVRLRRWLG